MSARCGPGCSWCGRCTAAWEDDDPREPPDTFDPPDDDPRFFTEYDDTLVTDHFAARGFSEVQPDLFTEPHE